MNVLKNQHLKLPFASNILFFPTLHSIQPKSPSFEPRSGLGENFASAMNKRACMPVQCAPYRGQALINQKIKWQRLRGDWCLGPWSTTQKTHFYTIWWCSTVNWYIGLCIYKSHRVYWLRAIPVKARWLSVDHPQDWISGVALPLIRCHFPECFKRKY